MDFDRSIGLASENVAEYSTMPRALRGANWMSVMMAVVWILGIDLAVKTAAQNLVWPGLAEDLTSKRGRFAAFDHDARYARLSAARPNQDGRKRKHRSLQHRGHYSETPRPKSPSLEVGVRSGAAHVREAQPQAIVYDAGSPNAEGAAVFLVGQSVKARSAGENPS